MKAATDRSNQQRCEEHRPNLCAERSRRRRLRLAAAGTQGSAEATESRSAEKKMAMQTAAGKINEENNGLAHKSGGAVAVSFCP
jgi:hypothetical protein